MYWPIPDILSLHDINYHKLELMELIVLESPKPRLAELDEYNLNIIEQEMKIFINTFSSSPKNP
jgi:hypothetical protein